MIQTSTLFLLLAALGTPGSASAAPLPSRTDVDASPVQGRSAVAWNAALADRDRVDADVHADGTVWIRGRTYKASFGSAGATYIPFLGSDAPQNYPLELRVTRVTIDGVELAFDADAPAISTESSVQFDRGTFVERYLLAPDGIEQTFVFDALPRRGEIVVSIGVESELAGRGDAEGFVFENDRGHVRYGRAFAFDRTGEVQSIESRLAQGVIELRVPAARVADARLPLVVDPVISTFAVRDTAIDEFAADTAYDAAQGAYLTVFEEVFSAQDHDVRAMRHSASGGSLVWQWVDSSAANWRTPAVANNAAAHQFLVVAAVGAVPGREIQGRRIQASTMAISSTMQISDPAAPGDKHSPDVGGDPAPTGTTRYFVVWEAAPLASQRDVHGRHVEPDGTLSPGGAILLSAVVGDLDGNPSISNSNGDGALGARYWNVVFEREIAPGNRDIYGRRVTANGSLMPGPSALASSSADERNPTATAGREGIASDTPWMLTYQIENGAAGWDVRTRLFDDLAPLVTFDLSAQFGTNTLHQTEPVCDTDGEHFVVAYLEQALLGWGTTDIKVSTLSFENGVVSVLEGNVSVSPGLETDLRPKLCAAHAGGADSNEFLVVFDRDEGSTRDVLATTYSVPAEGPIAGFCFGDGSGAVCPCGNAGAAGNGCASSLNPAGANLAASGTASVAADSIVLTGSGMPNAPCLYFQGVTQIATSFGDGLRCAGGTIVRLGTRTNSSGASQYPSSGDLSVSARGLVPAGGATRTYQCWYRNEAVFCTAATFNLTNGVRITWSL